MTIDIVGNLVTTAKAVVSIFVILAVGVTLTKLKVLDQNGVTALSKLVNYLFLPIALFARLGSTLSVEVLSKTWTLPFVGLVPVALSFVIGAVLMPLTKAPMWLRPWILVGLAFPNNLALPLVFLTSICGQVEFDVSDNIAADPIENATATLTVTECRELGELYLFMGNLFSTFVFWLFAYDLAAFVTGGNPSMSVSRDKAESLASAGTDESLASMNVVDNTSLEEARAAIPLPHEESMESSRSCCPLPENVTSKLRKAFGNPPTVAQLVAILVGLVPALRSFVFSSESVFSPVMGALTIFSLALVPALNLVLSGSLGLKLCDMKSIWEPNLASVGLSTRTLVVLLVIRMLLLPVLSFMALYALRVVDVLPDNRLLNLVFYFTVLTPTSNGPIVLAQMSGNAAAGQALALIILFQYMAGLVTMSLSVFLAFWLSAGVEA